MTPLVWRLLLIAASYSPQRLNPTLGAKAVSYVLTAADDEGAPGDDAALALVWAIQESAATPSAMSPDNLDAGMMQLRGPARQGYSAAELQADPVLSVRLWLRWLGVARKACPGSTARALGALSTGRCGGAPTLVRRRMKVAGVSP